MSIHFRRSFGLVFGACAVLTAVAGSTRPAMAQPLTTGFTYQGELASAGTPASGSYDIRFRLYNAGSGGSQIGSTLCSDNLAVTGGRFAAALDFGAVFSGQQRFLEIEVRQDTGLDCADASGYTVLSPRQELTATPNAVFALTAATATSAGNALTLGGQPSTFFTNAANLTGTLPSARLSGVYASPLTLNNPANIFTGNGAGITNLSAANISAGVLDAVRMPTNWAAGGDLGGFFPSPTITAGAVTLGKLAPDVQGAISKLSYLTPGPVLLDAIAFGLNNRGQINVPALPPGVTYVAVAGGGLHSLGLRSNGAVVGWGDSSFGQLNVPALPAGVTYSGVAAGNIHSLAVRSDGLIAGWGGNFAGQTSVPGLPAGVTYTAVACGRNHGYGLRSDGLIAAWGDNSSGQLNVPTLPAGVTYSAVAGGDSAGFALRTDGSVVAWGSSFSGQLIVPALIPGVTYTAVAGGGTHGLALRSDGTVAAWGSNANGQLNVPALPAGLRYTAVAAGNLHSLAMRSDGAVVAFGINLDGQCNVPALPQSVIYTAVASGPVSYHSLTVRSNTFAPSLGVTVGLSIGSITPPPASGGISVAGASSFASGLSAALFSGSGTGLTNLNASSITTGTLANTQTTGTNLNSPGTLVLRDASGNFSAGTINATLNGTSTNATQLNSQPASFYTSATSITTGTLDAARLPATAARTDLANVFTSTGNTTFAGNLGIAGAAATSPLRVRGDAGFEHLRIDPGASTIGSFISLNATPIAGGNQYLLFSSGGTAGEGQGKFAIKNQTTQTFGFVMTSSGNVGIGTLDPTSRLTVAGNMNVTGSLAKAGGSFKIDHPLDPENKYLYHSFVESPDMMNIYNGNVTTDGNGYATITMPDYFEALNRDFRYQLTVIDSANFALVRISRKMEGNTFEIASNLPNIEVSWTVTGIRQDAWANKNRIPNSVDKTGDEKGKLLHPEAFDQPASKGVYDGGAGR